MKKIALVGSTGSIGRQTLSVVESAPERFEIVCLIAGSNFSALRDQIDKFTPAYAAITDENAAKDTGDIASGCRLLKGRSGALTALKECGADVAVIACGGFAGLEYSLTAINLGMALALANKETMVCGGELIKKDACIMPVDSEHSAIWQCLNFKREAPFSRLVITASGGPFRGRKWESLSSVTPEEALNHPTWKMGAKITVDSATMLNKGYEIIEAHHLYRAPYEKISAVIHPQSIVHSMVQFEDGATLAQLSYPTMELPIRLALTYPERMQGGLRQLDFNEALTLQFTPLNEGDYPVFDLCMRCARAGGILPTVLNAASEVAVAEFLKGAIRFTDVLTVAEATLQKFSAQRVESFEQLSHVDGLSRAYAKEAAHRIGS